MNRFLQDKLGKLSSLVNAAVSPAEDCADAEMSTGADSRQDEESIIAKINKKIRIDSETILAIDDTDPRQ